MRTYRLGDRGAPEDPGEPGSEEPSITDQERERCWDMGRRARLRGVDVEDGPYLPWTPFDLSWRRGWWGIHRSRPPESRL